MRLRCPRTGRTGQGLRHRIGHQPADRHGARTSSDSAAGLRTFSLGRRVRELLFALLDERSGSTWMLAVGLLVIAGSMIASISRRSRRSVTAALPPGSHRHYLWSGGCGLARLRNAGGGHAGHRHPPCCSTSRQS